jgi:hypothetical protein
MISNDNLFLKSPNCLAKCLFHFTGSGDSFHSNLSPLVILQAVDSAGVCDNQSSGESSFLLHPVTILILKIRVSRILLQQLGVLDLLLADFRWTDRSRPELS